MFLWVYTYESFCDLFFSCNKNLSFVFIAKRVLHVTGPSPFVRYLLMGQCALFFLSFFLFTHCKRCWPERPGHDGRRSPASVPAGPLAGGIVARWHSHLQHEQLFSDGLPRGFPNLHHRQRLRKFSCLHVYKEQVVTNLLRGKVSPVSSFSFSEFW